MKQKIVLLILRYFHFFAKLQLLKNKPLIIGITGSAGKTSTRDAIIAVISNTRKVKVSYGANSESGIPLNILGLSPKKFSLTEWFYLILMCPIKLITNWEKYDIYIVEMGIDSPDSPKNMEYLLTIIKPNIGVFLNAAPMHSEPFDYLVETDNPEQRAVQITQLITNEKGKIVTTLDKNQTAILNIDQKELEILIPQIQAKLTSFGTKSSSTIQINTYNLTTTSTNFSFTINKEKLELQFKSLLLPKHFGYTFAAAIGVGISLGISPSQIKKNLEKNFKLPPGRATLIEGINNSVIIDSSYNSSTKPTIDMLDLLHKMPGNRKIALLGDMRELGIVSGIEHEKIARKASEICDVVLLVGPQMKQFSLPIIENTKTQVHWFKNAYQASDFLKNNLKKNDVLLVKASQNTLLFEIAVENLMAHRELANQLLPRRGSFWDKKREEINSI